MPINGGRLPFTDAGIALAPDRQGVYALYEGDRECYIGTADSIRAELEAHRRGDINACTGQATDYRSELSDAPAERERDLLGEFAAQWGRAPRCNQPVA
jgi:hypothetical protein